MTFSTLTRGTAALALLVSLGACSTGEPDDTGGGDVELITQVTISLTNEADASDSVTIVASDPDGDGAGITFSPASVALRPGASYAGAIDLLDTINNTSITAEVSQEAEEHLFRYAFQPSSAGTVTATDTESNYTTAAENSGDYAVGLAFRATVAESASGSGTLTAVLYHFDDAPKTSSTATSDEIDIDIAFPVRFLSVAARR